MSVAVILDVDAWINVGITHLRIGRHVRPLRTAAAEQIVGGAAQQVHAFHSHIPVPA